MLNYKKTNFIFLILLILLLVLSFFTTIKWWWFLILFSIRFVVLIIGSSFIQLNFHVKSYCNNPNEKDKKIALTFDDGPTNFTIEILDLLKQYNAKATFFCIGKNVEKHPEIIKKIDIEGHLIGNHSYSHSHFFDFYSTKKVYAELEKTDSIIEKIINKKPQFFRPPYGVINPSIRRVLNIKKHKVIGWNIRSFDGLISNEKLIFNKIKKQLKPGSVILMHDTSVHSVNVLKQLLLFLQTNNYQIISIENLLKINAYED